MCTTGLGLQSVSTRFEVGPSLLACRTSICPVFQQIRLPLPPLTIQRKIAAILSAYDDLIENNNRRIKLLEEMAQRIYREWFVDFRYPGHENVQLVDSELGPIPQGWRVAAFADLAAIAERWYTAELLCPNTGTVTSPLLHATRRIRYRCGQRVRRQHVAQSGLDALQQSAISARDSMSSRHAEPLASVVIGGGGNGDRTSRCYAVRGHRRRRPGLRRCSALLNQVDCLKTNAGGATVDTIIVDTFRRMRCRTAAAQTSSQRSRS